MKAFLRWLGIAVGSLVGLVILAIGAVYAITEWRFARDFEVDVPPISVVADSASIAHGAHLALIRGCVDCHGDRMEGTVIIDDPLLGRIAGSNLTPGEGGVAGRYRTAADWVRAIRHGVAPDGRPLLLMPAHEFQHLSDSDVASLIAYFQALPPVDHHPPGLVVRPLGRLLYVIGELPLIPAEIIDHDAAPRPAPAAAATREFGAYLATGCSGCHGTGFSGGRAPGVPPGFPDASNLTPHPTGLASWTRDDFARALRTGIRPDGRELNPWMPWRLTAHMTDVEIDALWAFFESLPPREKGNL
ncbi:MAG TPA: c-type cytochrome [Rhodothermales bacterium]